jgi:transposase
MIFFPQNQRVFILEHYFSTRSYAECQNAFRNYFPDSVVPNKSTVQRLVERFRETGSIGEKRRSDLPSVLSNYSLEDIRARLFQSPRKSLRKLSQETGTLIKLGLQTVLLPHGLRDFWITLYLPFHAA